MRKYSASYFGPTTSKIEQVAFTQYIVDGYLQKHLRKLVREYKEKHLYLKKLIDTYMGCSYIWTRHIWRIGWIWMWMYHVLGICVNRMVSQLVF